MRHRHRMCLLSGHLPHGRGKVSHGPLVLTILSFISRLCCGAARSAWVGSLRQLLADCGALTPFTEDCASWSSCPPQLLADISLSYVCSSFKVGLTVCVAQPNSLAKLYVQFHLVHLLLSHPCQKCNCLGCYTAAGETGTSRLGP